MKIVTQVVYLARNPKDVLNSMYAFYSRTPILKGVSFDAVFDQFVNEGGYILRG